jgi:hypothetical protein
VQPHAKSAENPNAATHRNRRASMEKRGFAKARFLDTK